MKIGRTDVITHQIIIDPDIYSIKTRPYPLAPKESEFLQKELDYFENLSIIKKCENPWATPILFIKKKNSKLHLVVDYCKLNKVTRKDTYPLPRIDELLDSLGNMAMFLILDMYSGFYQIEVDPKSHEKTAFIMKYGIYQYNQLPMSLCNSPATFQHLVNIIFAGSLRNYIVTYIDDLNIYSKINNNHFQYLYKVFE